MAPQLHVKAFRIVGVPSARYTSSLQNNSKLRDRSYNRRLYLHYSFNNSTVLSSITETLDTYTKKSNLFKLENDNLKSSLKLVFTQAVLAAYPWNSREISLTECANLNLGDYQCNDAMQIFSIIREMEGNGIRSPREVAENIINKLPPNRYFEKPTIAGPGFINVKISESFIATNILKFLSGEEEAKETAVQETSNDKFPLVVVDFSSPNIAKEMHVGHLRSTIIGDSICRMLEYKKIKTLRLNHVGDWGTQFGMLIEYLYDEHNGMVDTISDLQASYKLAKKRFDDDADFKVRAQAAVVKLQAGDKKMLEVWEKVCQTSRSEFETIYNVLGVKISERGESFYNAMLSDVLEELVQKKVAVESEGALCIFNSLDGTPLICKKSDGGFNYASTDLAAIYHRIIHEKANWIIYVTDSGQKKHFDGIFDAAKRAGWIGNFDNSNVQLDHVGFGLVMGEDGKRFRTRSGDVIRLKELLDESETRCFRELQNRGNSGLDLKEIKQTASKLGVGAIKYADLQNNLSTNYVFSFDRMLDFKGNTAIYLQYAHVRASAVLSKTKIDVRDSKLQQFSMKEKEERQLALHILKFSEALDSALLDLMPSRICDYLYTLSVLFNEFYGSCKVIGGENEESRILLCYATAKVMRRCFLILGIEPVYKL